MSISPAVFLSYASQDAEAAARIADALRAADVEVWFDKSELVGGDAWDAKIRQQIQSCTLFVPIISANTQVRSEGYFRLEWKLAVDRSHLMADDTPFLFPVVLDHTTDAEARVPDRFRERQWMRLDATTPAAIATRLATVLSVDAGERPIILSHTSPSRPPQSPASSARKRPALSFGVITAILIAIAVAFWSSRRSDESLSAPSPQLEPSQSRTEQLIAQAQKLYEPMTLASSDDLELAETLLTEAAKLEPGNADAWAALSLASYTMIEVGFDASNARREIMRNAATRAGKLAPESDSASIAQAMVYSTDENTHGEALALLKPLAKSHPENKTVLRELGDQLRQAGRIAEAESVYRQSDALPGGDPSALFDLTFILRMDGRIAEAERTINRILELRPNFGLALTEKAFVLSQRGDLTAVRETLLSIPPRLLADERVAALTAEYWLALREPENALASLKQIKKDYIEFTYFNNPKGLLVGQAHHMAGRPEAANLEWRSALRVVEQRLTKDPTNQRDLINQAQLQALLGDRDTGLKTLRLSEQLAGNPVGKPTFETFFAYGSLAQEAAVAAYLEENLSGPRGPALLVARFFLLRDEFDQIRDQPALAPALTQAHALVASVAQVSTTTAPAKSIAVLPFANLSPDPANAFFCEGMHDDILNTLTQVRELKVISRTSTLRYRDNTRPLRDVAAELGVAHVLEGSVRRAGNRVRITAQLIDAATDESVWAETFDRNLDDVFAIQSEIAQNIADALQAAISPEEQARIDKLPTANHAAYDLYLRGRSLWNTATKENNDEARRLFRAAIALDPEFALAWTALADTYVFTLVGAMDEPTVVLEQGRPALERALALDPDLAEAHLSLAVLLINYEWDWAGAKREFLRALELNDRVAATHHQYAWFLFWRQRHEEALVHFRRAAELDPQAPLLRADLNAPLEELGRLDEALEHIEAAITIDPDFQFGYALKAKNLFKQGQAVRGRAALQQARNMGAPSPLLLTWSAIAAANQGTAEGRSEARDFLQQLELLRADRYIDPGDHAFIYAALNEPDRAFEYLDQAYVDRGVSLLWLPMDRNFDPLRDDPRFEALYDKMNFNFPE